MREPSITWKPRADVARDLLGGSIRVLRDYTKQGYPLTLMPLHHQLAARDLVANQQRWYDQLGDDVSRGRIAGFLVWSSIVDRGQVPLRPRRDTNAG